MPDFQSFILYPFDGLFAKTQSSMMPRILAFLFGVLIFVVLAVLAAVAFFQAKDHILVFVPLLLGILVLVVLSVGIHLFQGRQVLARHAAFIYDVERGRFFYVMAEPDPSQPIADHDLQLALKQALKSYLVGQRPAEGPPTIWEIAPQGYLGASRGQLLFIIRDHKGKQRIAKIPDAFPGIPEAVENTTP